MTALLLAAAGGVGTVGGIGALAWVAFKVGALSFGGGFVIIPLMQHDAVHTYHWMSSAQFLNAVALGQVTPGPVVATVAAVGYAARGMSGGAVLAAVVAFTPSFVAVMIGGPRFEQIRGSARAQAFLDGAGPAAIGAILGSAVLLAGAPSSRLADPDPGRRCGRAAADAAGRGRDPRRRRRDRHDHRARRRGEPAATAAHTNRGSPVAGAPSVADL